MLPAGTYVFLEGVDLDFFTESIVVRPGARFILGNNSKMHLLSKQVVMKGTESEKISFISDTPGSKGHIRIRAPYAFEVSVPSKAYLAHCVFEGLNGGTRAAVNITYVYAQLSDIEVRNCSGAECGGIRISNSVLQLNSCSFKNNTARVSGGAGVYALDTILKGKDCEFLGNCSGESAGGLGFAAKTSPVAPKCNGIVIPDKYYGCVLKNTVFKDNVAWRGSAVLVWHGAVLLENDCCVEGNKKPQLSAAGEDAIITYSPKIIKDGNE